MPNVARIYDFLLEGKDNYASDREAAEKLLAALPDVRQSARQNRDFVGRVVRFLVGECGIRQFLDIGSGLPTQGNVHEVALAVSPDVRVVYTDNDMVVIRHGQALIGGDPRTLVIEGDVRQPAEIIGNEELRRHIDFDEPVALLLTSLLHFVPDDTQAYESVEYLINALPSGSYMAISHGVKGQVTRSAATQVRNLYQSSSARAEGRGPAELTRFLSGLEILEPGLVPLEEWRPDSRRVPEVGDHAQPAGRPLMLGGLGRKA